MDLHKDINCVQLPNADQAIPKELIIAGWGSDKRPDTRPITPNDLSVVKLAVFDAKPCTDKGIALFDEICVGDPSQLIVGADWRLAKGACFNDFGAPAVSFIGTKYILIGMLSQVACPDGEYFPEAYVKVASFFGWIKEEMAK